MKPLMPIKLPDWVGRGLKNPITAAAALSLGVRLGQESTRLRAGEINHNEFRKRTGRHVGAVSGSLTGASVGAVLGRLWPGPGTIAGAFVGGMLGEMWGERAGRAVVDRVWTQAEKPQDVPVEPVDDHSPEQTRRKL